MQMYYLRKPIQEVAITNVGFIDHNLWKYLCKLIAEDSRFQVLGSSTTAEKVLNDTIGLLWIRAEEPHISFKATPLVEIGLEVFARERKPELLQLKQILNGLAWPPQNQTRASLECDEMATAIALQKSGIHFNPELWPELPPSPKPEPRVRTVIDETRSLY